MRSALALFGLLALAGCGGEPEGVTLPIEKDAPGADCTTGEALLDEPGELYVLEEECGRVVIQGSGIEVEAASIGQLEIFGDENVVDASGSIGSVIIDGDDNFVTTLLTVGMVNDLGEGNVVVTP